MANRVLIIKPSALGDVATTLPLLCDLRAALPGAEIDWLIHPAYVPVIAGHDALHEAVLFDRKNLAAWWYKPASTRRFTGLLATLRERNYDVVLDAQGLFRSGFLTRITGARMRIGFAHAREGAALAYTHQVTLPERGRRMLAVDRIRALGVPVGTDITRAAEFRMPVSVEARAKADSLLATSGVVGGHYAVVIPGARWNTKRWPIERYADIVRRLVGEGRKVALLGSADEKSLCDQIESEVVGANAKVSNFAGATDISTMIALLAHAELVVGNDSGPLHLAAALGTKVVALYGPTSPQFVGPYGQMENVLRHAVECHPCRRRECDHHSCMQGLKVELVWERVQWVAVGSK